MQKIFSRSLIGKMLQPAKLITSSLILAMLQLTSEENTTILRVLSIIINRELYDLESLQVQHICSIISYNNKIGNIYALAYRR